MCMHREKGLEKYAKTILSVCFGKKSGFKIGLTKEAFLTLLCIFVYLSKNILLACMHKKYMYNKFIVQFS